MVAAWCGGESRLAAFLPRGQIKYQPVTIRRSAVVRLWRMGGTGCWREGSGKRGRAAEQTAVESVLSFSSGGLTRRKDHGGLKHDRRRDLSKQSRLWNLIGWCVRTRAQGSAVTASGSLRADVSGPWRELCLCVSVLRCPVVGTVSAGQVGGTGRDRKSVV